MGDNDIRIKVRERYANIANKDSGCGCSPVSCCGDTPSDTSAISTKLGYTIDELKDLPEGADLGLGCGNPTAIASILPGETILDLGSGAGIDCFLASKKTGSEGHIIGVDMTPDMVSKARENARKMGATNVEFRLGEIENLPVADSSVDLIISNCVINLSPDKQRVFNEMYRVLKPGGRIAVSDVVSLVPLTPEMKSDNDLYCGCVGGAIAVEEYTTALKNAGFADISVDIKSEISDAIKDWAPGMNLDKYIASAAITACKQKK